MQLFTVFIISLLAIVSSGERINYNGYESFRLCRF